MWAVCVAKEATHEGVNEQWTWSSVADSFGTLPFASFYEGLRLGATVKPTGWLSVEHCKWDNTKEMNERYLVVTGATQAH